MKGKWGFWITSAVTAIPIMTLGAIGAANAKSFYGINETDFRDLVLIAFFLWCAAGFTGIFLAFLKKPIAKGILLGFGISAPFLFYFFFVSALKSIFS